MPSRALQQWRTTQRAELDGLDAAVHASHRALRQHAAALAADFAWLETDLWPELVRADQRNHLRRRRRPRPSCRRSTS